MKSSLLFRMAVLCTAIGMAACSTDGFPLKDGDMSAGDSMSTGDESDVPDGDGHENHAGIITAGEWNDLENWDFWQELINAQDQQESYREHLIYWGLGTQGRIPVTVIDNDGNPVCGAKVELFYDEWKDPVWTAISDNKGSAELWYTILASYSESDEVHVYTISIDGVAIETPVTPNEENIVTVSNTATVQKIVDIAFIVDATGSMADEIQFLKDDMIDILNKVKVSQSDKSFRTAALFYRDTRDEYLTKYDNFRDDPSATLSYIKQQNARGGGDYPEAVHTALEESLQNLSWTEGGYARLAFLILDAPPHHDPKVMTSICDSMKGYAANGIKIIPVAASGIDRNTEALLRLMAIFTDGTYVFITDDSGVGNHHITPSVGEYQVESLNGLIVRLINKYSE